MLSEPIVILSMDLSISQPGFAVMKVDKESREPVVLSKTFIKTNAKQTHGQRLTDIAVEIERLIEEYSPNRYVREKAFGRHAGSTMILNKVVGMTDYIMYRDEGVLSIEEIAVGTIKKVVTGSGRASKVEVAEGVFKILGIVDTESYYTARGALIDDLTDAVAVGLTYMQKYEMIEI